MTVSSETGIRMSFIPPSPASLEADPAFLSRLRHMLGRMARDAGAASAHVVQGGDGAARLLASSGEDPLPPALLEGLSAAPTSQGVTLRPAGEAGENLLIAPFRSPYITGALVLCRPAASGEAERERAALHADLLAEILTQQAERTALLNERALLAHGPVGVLIWRAERALPLVFASSNLTRILGADMVARLEAGKRMDSLIHPDDREHFRLSIRAHLGGEAEKTDLSFRITLPDGTLRWVRQCCVTPALPHSTDRFLFAYLSDETGQHRQSEASALVRQRLSVAVEAANIGIFDLDVALGQRVSDDRIARMLGYEPGELDSLADHWWERVHPLDRERMRSKMDALTPWREVTKLEYRVRHRDNRYIWVQSFGKIVAYCPDGRPRRVIGTLMDITEHKRDEAMRAKQQQLLEVLNRAQASFMFTHDLQEACDGLFDPLLRLTDSAYGFIGVVRTTPEGKPYLLVPTISDLSWNAETRALYDQHLKDGGLQFHHLHNLFGRVVLQNEVMLSNCLETHPGAAGLPKGHPPLENFLGLPLRFGTSVVGMIGLANTPEGYEPELLTVLEPLMTTLGALIHALDVEVKRQRIEKELEIQATTDSLTGLLNRRQFEEVARQEVTRAAQEERPVTVAVLDLDHFKVVNDTHGHAAGDAVLKAFADRLRQSVRTGDVVCRFGGEEFAVLMPSTRGPQARDAMERLRVMMEAAPITYRGKAISVTLSAGLAEAGAGGVSLGKLLNAADKALYLAKSGGRNQVRLAGSDGSAIRLVRG